MYNVKSTSSLTLKIETQLYTTDDKNGPKSIFKRYCDTKHKLIKHNNIQNIMQSMMAKKQDTEIFKIETFNCE